MHIININIIIIKYLFHFGETLFLFFNFSLMVNIKTEDLYSMNTFKKMGETT